VNHAIALKFAGDVFPIPLDDNESPDFMTRVRTIYNNPVASERFFDFMVKLFLAYFVMGGVFGPVSKYFGENEEQGRKSLHMHLVMWLMNLPAIDEIKQKLMKDAKWKKEFLEFIDSLYHSEIMMEPKSSDTKEDGKCQQYTKHIDINMFKFHSVSLVSPSKHP
jgi:hypothetical protein